MCQECILLPLYPQESLRSELSPGYFLQVPCTLSVCCGFGDKDVGSWRILRCKQENMASSYYMEWGYHSPRAEACAQGACQRAASELWASPSPPHSLGHPPGESVSFSEAAVVEQALRPHRCVLTLCVVLGKSVNSCYSSCVMSENKTG